MDSIPEECTEALCRGIFVSSLPQSLTAFSQGLAWVLLYYYQGCPSWEWFYPFYHAPMASDLVGLAEHCTAVQFSLGKPFTPFQQLMAVGFPLAVSLLGSDVSFSCRCFRRIPKPLSLAYTGP